MKREIIEFLIVGAGKAGTTWLANNLRKHPGIFIPDRKELFYFNERMVEFSDVGNVNRTKPIDWYEDFFKSAQPFQVKGEASPAYLWDEKAPRNIYNYNPNIKLIAILRNPVERAFSHYLFDIQRSVIDSIDFSQAIVDHKILIEMGMYALSLERYYELFPSENILVLLFDDLLSDSRALLKNVELFLGVEEFIPHDIDQAENITGEPRFGLLNLWVTKVRYFLRKHNLNFIIDFLRSTGLSRLSTILVYRNVNPYETKPPLDPSSKRKLIEIFKPDVIRLEELIRRDLSSWKVEGVHSGE